MLATDVVSIGARDAIPLEAIARRIAARLGERGAPLAAHVPSLREAVSEQLVTSSARRNGLTAAAARVRRPDLPFLALNEVRLVRRLAQAHGASGGVRDRLPELAATLGAGFGLRALARELLDLAPPTDAEGASRPAGRSGPQIAYGATRAVGEAARMRFALAPMRQPGGAVRAEP